METKNLTEDQKKYIQDNYLSKEYKEIAQILGIPHYTIQNYCKKNSLTKRNIPLKNKKIKKFLEKYYITYSNTAIAAALNIYEKKSTPWDRQTVRKLLISFNFFRTNQQIEEIKKNKAKTIFIASKNPVAPKKYFQLDAKTRIELRPGQSIDALKKKYNIPLADKIINDSNFPKKNHI
jgi:hypothetical protein